jgi:hypothetical protein
MKMKMTLAVIAVSSRDFFLRFCEACIDHGEQAAAAGGHLAPFAAWALGWLSLGLARGNGVDRDHNRVRQMATIGELIINLNASTAAFVTELERVKNLSFDTAAQVQRSFSLIGTAALGMLSVAAGAFAEGVNKTAEWEVHILHLAESAGTSTEAISGLSLAAKMMGLDIDTVAKALERFDKQLLQAGAGNAKSQQNLSLLGIDPAQIKTSDDALKQLADHFAAMPDGAVKTGEAMMAFGKAGAAMIPILNEGSQGIQAWMDQAKAMGLVITKDQAEQAELFEQNTTRMKESLHGLWVEITNKTLPALNDLTTQMLKTENTKGFLAVVGEWAAMLTQGGPAISGYIGEGEKLIAQQEKMRPKLADLTASFATHQKAIDTLKKSVESIVTTYQTEIATMGMTNLQVTEYKLRADAAKLGVAAWVDQEIRHIDLLNQKKTWLERIAVLDNSKIDEEKKNFLADKLNLDLQDLDVMQQQLDLVMQQRFAPTSTFNPAPEATQAFTAAITQQTAALERQIATFGMSAEQIARYDLAQLDSSQLAQDQIVKFKALQDQMDAMNAHAKTTTEAWKQFGEVAQRSLDDLIFSGKSFTQVLSDITKQLGEMFLKWALFGFGESNSKSGGGLFGLLAGSLGPIFGLAGGGPVAAGQTVMVGEQGPELFTPSTSGYVIPNGVSSGGASVNVVYQIDARGSSITEEQFRRSMASSENRAVQRALNMARETQLRTA